MGYKDLPSSNNGPDALAVMLGGKNVRTTRFESISAGTSGTLAQPPDSTYILDDFGGTTDAVVSGMAAGKPTFQKVLDTNGDPLAVTLDSAGNWAFTGTPSSYPVAILYRVEQEAQYFDSMSSNIVGIPTLLDQSIITDHGELDNLNLDHHLQYHTDARGDIRYYTKAQSDANYEPKNANIQTHIADTNNPHNTTAAQVGLGNLTNDLQLKASDLDTDGTLAANSDTKITSQKAVKTYVDSKLINVQLFTSSGTYTKPLGAKWLKVITLGGGGGGGSGRVGATASARSGGSGGAAGLLTLVEIDAALVAATVAVTVAAGGTGGAGIPGTANTNGNPGGTGGTSMFGTHAKAAGGGGGNGGTNAAVNGGTTPASQSSPWNFAAIGGGNAPLGIGITPSNQVFIGSNGGAGGGGMAALGGANAGSQGGGINSVLRSSIVSGGAAGVSPANASNGVDVTLFNGFSVGTGGGSTSSSTTGATGNGGSGGRGAGGGGSGASENGNASGNGGNGGPGAVLVLTYF